MPGTPPLMEADEQQHVSVPQAEGNGDSEPERPVTTGNAALSTFVFCLLVLRVVAMVTYVGYFCVECGYVFSRVFRNCFPDELL
jgi:hypothetical protein